MLKRGQAHFGALGSRLGPASIGALMLLFTFQGEAILAQPLVIALLAVAIAISLFGFQFGALATVVGVLIEAPLMQAVVNRSKSW